MNDVLNQFAVISCYILRYKGRGSQLFLLSRIMDALAWKVGKAIEMLQLLSLTIYVDIKL